MRHIGQFVQLARRRAPFQVPHQWVVSFFRVSLLFFVVGGLKHPSLHADGQGLQIDRGAETKRRGTRTGGRRERGRRERGRRGRGRQGRGQRRRRARAFARPRTVRRKEFVQAVPHIVGGHAAFSWVATVPRRRTFAQIGIRPLPRLVLHTPTTTTTTLAPLPIGPTLATVGTGDPVRFSFNAVPSVFDVVLRPSRQMVGDLAPLIAQPCMHVVQHQHFRGGPRALVDRRVQVVVPPLAHLFAGPARDGQGQIGPFDVFHQFAGMAFQLQTSHPFEHGGVLRFGPRTLFGGFGRGNGGQRLRFRGGGGVSGGVGGGGFCVQFFLFLFGRRRFGFRRHDMRRQDVHGT